MIFDHFSRSREFQFFSLFLSLDEIFSEARKSRGYEVAHVWVSYVNELWEWTGKRGFWDLGYLNTTTLEFSVLLAVSPL